MDQQAHVGPDPVQTTGLLGHLAARHDQANLELRIGRIGVQKPKSLTLAVSSVPSKVVLPTATWPVMTRSGPASAVLKWPVLSRATLSTVWAEPPPAGLLMA